MPRLTLPGAMSATGTAMGLGLLSLLEGSGLGLNHRGERAAGPSFFFLGTFEREKRKPAKRGLFLVSLFASKKGNCVVICFEGIEGGHGKMPQNGCRSTEMSIVGRKVLYVQITQQKLLEIKERRVKFEYACQLKLSFSLRMMNYVLLLRTRTSVCSLEPF